jgi:hypothetical protein
LVPALRVFSCVFCRRGGLYGKSLWYRFGCERFRCLLLEGVDPPYEFVDEVPERLLLLLEACDEGVGGRVLVCPCLDRGGRGLEVFAD